MDHSDNRFYRAKQAVAPPELLDTFTLTTDSYMQLTCPGCGTIWTIDGRGNPDLGFITRLATQHHHDKHAQKKTL